ncbi:MAG TPA: UPF0182 family protein [Tepidiformaceae bacterium]
MTQPPHDEGRLGPPPPIFRFPYGDGGTRRVARSRGTWRWVVIAAGILAAFVLLNIARGIYVDVLWFDSVGFRSVYTTEITTKVWLFLAATVVAFLVILGNALLARRLAPAADTPGFEVSYELRQLFSAIEASAVHRILLIAAIVLSFLAALNFGSAAASHWKDVLLFAHSQSFGTTDPQFHRDLGFYVFQLPVYQFAVDWLLAALVLGFIASVAVYALRGVLYGFRIDAPRPIMRHIFDIESPRWIKLHLSLLIVVFFLILIVRFYLSRFSLVYSSQGVDVGAFYTDLHATLPMIYVQMAVAGIAAALVLIGLYRGGLALPAGALVIWILASTLSGIYPAIVQRFSVQPNELAKEEPYLARNIDMTRYAYGLDKIDERQFPANAQATDAEVQANQDTINNVRLWDPDPLKLALNQIQTIRPLFEFRDVDVDRYTIDGKYRQVLLSARELNPNNLPANAQTWVNRTLQFTHGYGYTIAAVTVAQPDGSPSLIEQDIPLAGPITTARPEVYFGEEPDHFIIVDGNQPEFTPAAGGENVQTKFQGSGGVKLSSIIQRVAYAWTFGDPNILISGAISNNSRIIYRRNIQQRISEIAPFLKLDADPYLVVDQDNMYWIQDAYTVTDLIPYAHRINGLNYMQNSVKVVVNAYSGETTFYAAEPDEPILKAYAAVFPHLFRPLSDLPDSLKAHLRYPEDLFHFQTQAYLRYHITDVSQFYQQEDQWDIPTVASGSQDQAIQPYYVIARLPGETKEEFMLILPFVPRNRTNAIAWMAARSDGDNYGKLVAFRFPAGVSVPGPTQVERRIDSDGRVSQQLTLWNQSGSKVIRGDLLMIPIGSANLFIEPLYLAATAGGNEIPQLKRVVVVNGDNVAMEPTLSRAIDVLFGRADPSGLDSGGASSSASPTPGTGTPTATATATPTPGSATPVTGGTPVTGSDLTALIAQAEDVYNSAQAALRAGDFAGYGAQTAILKQLLDRIYQVVPTATPTPAH